MYRCRQFYSILKFTSCYSKSHETLNSSIHFRLTSKLTSEGINNKISTNINIRTTNVKEVLNKEKCGDPPSPENDDTDELEEMFIPGPGPDGGLEWGVSMR